MDYIEREAAVRALDGVISIEGVNNASKVNEYINGVIERLRALPGVDAQSEVDYWHDKAQSYEQTILRLTLGRGHMPDIVRCGDCLYYHKRYQECHGDFCYDSGRKPSEFCSSGKRRFSDVERVREG